MEFIKSFYIPYHFNKITDLINQKIVLKSLRLDGSKKQIIWATYINGFTFNIFKRAHYKILDFATRRQVSQDLSTEVKRIEIEAVKIADIVFVDNYNTYLDYYPYNKNTFYVPQGVNIDDFDSNEIAPELRHLKTEYKTIVGYCGNLHKYVDYNLLHKIIPLMSDHVFVFVGNIMDNRANALSEFDNVIFTGFKRHSELHKYYRLFDVGLIPYTVEPFTTGVYPTKFLEYVANHVPVVSSRLPDLEQYDLAFLQIYTDESSFQTNITKLSCIDANDEMDFFVLQNTWEQRFLFMTDKIEELIK